MSTAADLWGDLDAKTLVRRTPLTIMREQAAILGQKTGNIVEARVVTETQYTGEFYIGLDLVVPSLDNYTYRLLKIAHPITLYPIKDLASYQEIQDETAFVEWLRTKLSSAETRGIIGNLFSQAAA